ncbi:hypothetical protein P5V15_001353 [Pogonomyrmex californicus]
MSLMLTLSGKNSVLAANYFPIIDLSDDDYELGLTILETYHMIPNVNASNNKFYFDEDDAEITIPERSYKLQVINEFLKREILDGNVHDATRPITTPVTSRAAMRLENTR